MNSPRQHPQNACRPTAPLTRIQWRTIGADQSLSRFCAIEFSLRKKASMAQRNNASTGIGAALAQNAMLLPRARSAPNPLCAIGPRSRLTAPLGQKRTLVTFMDGHRTAHGTGKRITSDSRGVIHRHNRKTTGQRSAIATGKTVKAVTNRAGRRVSRKRGPGWKFAHRPIRCRGQAVNRPECPQADDQVIARQCTGAPQADHPRPTAPVV
jgi:hypothetical protein